MYEILISPNPTYVYTVHIISPPHVRIYYTMHIYIQYVHTYFTYMLCLCPVSCTHPGSGRFEEARQYLSQAQWVILSTPNPSADNQSQLHRNLGLLALAKGEISEARRHLAEDIYQSSVAFGPESIQTAGGYFHLATAFVAEEKPDVVLSLHNQVHTHACLQAYLLMHVLELNMYFVYVSTYTAIVIDKCTYVRTYVDCVHPMFVRTYIRMYVNSIIHWCMFCTCYEVKRMCIR